MAAPTYPAGGKHNGWSMHIQSALELANLGLPVIPLHSLDRHGNCSCGNPNCGKHAGKHPREKDWPTTATTDHAQIIKWAAQWPGSNIGIATGKGLIVLDVDNHDSLKALVSEHEPLPETARACTGSGGTHYYFRTPIGVPISNSVGTLAPGLDIRGDHGQVVAPPSSHYSGNRYDWWRHPQHGIATIPGWLLDLIKTEPKLTNWPRSRGEARARRLRRRSPSPTPHSDDVLTDIIQRYPVDGPGTRYHAMVRAVGSLVGRGYSEQDVLDLMMAWLDHYDGQYESDRDACQAQLEQCLRSTLSSTSFDRSGGYDRDYPLRELTAVQQQFLDAILTDSLITIPEGGAYAVYHPLHVRDGRNATGNTPSPTSNAPSPALLDMKRTGLLARGSVQKAFIDAWLCMVLHNLLDTDNGRVIATDKQVIELMRSRSGVDISPRNYYRLKHDYITRWKADQDGFPTDELQPARKCELLVEAVKGQRVQGAGLWPSEYDLGVFGWLLELEFDYPYWLETQHEETT